MVLNGVILTPMDIWQCWDILIVTVREEGATSIYWTEAMDAAKYPPMHGTDSLPLNRIDQPKMSTVTKLRKPGLHEINLRRGAADPG